MTLPPPDRPPHLPGYDLAPPSERDARAMLERVFGAGRGESLWADACRDARVQAGRVDTLPTLQRVSRSLAGAGGAAATVARSIDIRIRTYTRLATRGGDAQGASA